MLARLLLLLSFLSPAYLQAGDLLMEWNDNKTKKRILSFIKATANPKSKHYVAKENRIAVFDNDGTLWTEKPYYFQLMYLVDTIKKLALKEPELKEKNPYKAIVENDKLAIQKFKKDDVLKLLAKTHSGMTIEEFREQVKKWIDSNKHPDMNCQFNKLTYLPMKELLTVLNQYGYKVYIVTGGGTEFVRSVSNKLYGIPVEQVIGSQMISKVQYKDGHVVIARGEAIDYINDKEVKPLNIQRIIGKRPIIAVGNSDGDLPMLKYTSQGKTHLVILIWHTDMKREYAYDKNSSVGHLDKALTQATGNHWVVVNMKKDWKTIYSDKRCVRKNIKNPKKT